MHDTFVEINIHMKSLQLFFHNRQNNGERLANMIRVFQVLSTNFISLEKIIYCPCSVATTYYLQAKICF
jgi:hypothetical protein